MDRHELAAIIIFGLILYGLGVIGLAIGGSL